MSAFYAKVSTPVLADVVLDVDSVLVEDMYPYPLPDLFAGSQLLVVGRYRDGRAATVTLSGDVNGKAQVFRFEDVSFRRDGGDDFIPRLWATRKIGYLLNEIRLHVENAELVDQIVKLSIRYGIITPYTSFLVEEPEQALSTEGRDEIVQRAVEEAAAAPAAPSFGSEAVSDSEQQKALQDAEVAPAAGAAVGAGEAAQTGAVVTVADKAFVFRDGVWVDTTFDLDSMRAKPITAGSEAFFELLREKPEAAKYFAVGERVIVVLDGAAYESRPSEPLAEPNGIQPRGIGSLLQGFIQMIRKLFGG